MLIWRMVDESGCKDSVGEVDGCFGDPHYEGLLIVIEYRPVS